MNVHQMKTTIEKSSCAMFFQKNSKKIFCIICFLLVNFYLLLYLRPFNCSMIGHDSAYHYLRVEALKYNMQNSNLFSGIDYLFFNGGGYASFAYPSIFLYIPAILRVLGVGIGSSMTIFIVLCNVFSYYFMFLFLKKISGSPVCGTIGAILYVLSSYRLDNIVVRFALGEIQASVFWPLILYGLYDFIFDDFKKPYIIGFGFIGMFLSHSISTALAFSLCVFLSLVFIRRIIKTPKKLITLAITAGCVLAVTAYYWIPLIELFSSCDLQANYSPYHAGNDTIETANLFRDVRIRGLGIPIFLLCIPRIFLTKKSPMAKLDTQCEISKKRTNILVYADAFMIFGIIISLLPTKSAPWEILSKVLDFMQFPWRLFAVASILLISAGTIYMYHIIKFTKSSKLSMILITVVAVLCAFIHTEGLEVNHTYEYGANYYDNPETTFDVCMGEWRPHDAKTDMLKELDGKVVLSNDQKIDCERNNGTLIFHLNENNGITFAELPYIWYKGYTAENENGDKLDVSISENGLVQVDLQGISGEIKVEHKPTVLRVVSYIISALSVIVIGTTAFLKKRILRRKTAASYE